MAEMVPRALVSRAAAGEVDAFERLLAPVVESACVVAFGLLEDSAQAEEAVVSACRTAFLRLRGQDDIPALRLWFLAIVRRECKRRARRARPRRLRVEGDPGTTQRLRQAIGDLDFQARSLIVLHHYLGLSVEESARLERIKPERASRRLALAAEQLGALSDGSAGPPGEQPDVLARRIRRLVDSMGMPGPSLRPRIDRALRRSPLLTRQRALSAVAIAAAGLLVAAGMPLLPGWLRDAELALETFPIVPVASSSGGSGPVPSGAAGPTTLKPTVSEPQAAPRSR